MSVLSVMGNYDYPEMRRLAFSVTKEKAQIFAKAAYEMSPWEAGGFNKIKDPNDPLQVVAILAPFLGWLCPEAEWGIVYERRFTDIHYEIYFSYGEFRVQRNTNSYNFPWDHKELKAAFFLVLSLIHRKQDREGLALIDMDKLQKELGW